MISRTKLGVYRNKISIHRENSTEGRLCIGETRRDFNTSNNSNNGTEISVGESKWEGVVLIDQKKHRLEEYKKKAIVSQDGLDMSLTLLGQPSLKNGEMAGFAHQTH